MKKLKMIGMVGMLLALLIGEQMAYALNFNSYKVNDSQVAYPYSLAGTADGVVLENKTPAIWDLHLHDVLENDSDENSKGLKVAYCIQGDKESPTKATSYTTHTEETLIEQINRSTGKGSSYTNLDLQKIKNVLMNGYPINKTYIDQKYPLLTASTKQTITQLALWKVVYGKKGNSERAMQDLHYGIENSHYFYAMTKDGVTLSLEEGKGLLKVEDGSIPFLSSTTPNSSNKRSEVDKQVMALLNDLINAVPTKGGDKGKTIGQKSVDNSLSCEIGKVLEGEATMLYVKVNPQNLDVGTFIEFAYNFSDTVLVTQPLSSIEEISKAAFYKLSNKKIEVTDKKYANKSFYIGIKIPRTQATSGKKVSALVSGGYSSTDNMDHIKLVWGGTATSQYMVGATAFASIDKTVEAILPKFVFKNGSIRVTKKIAKEEIHYEHGVPWAIIRVEGTQEDGERRAYEKVVTFEKSELENLDNENGFVMKTVIFENVHEGVYYVSEKIGSRYYLEKIEGIKNAIVEANKQRAKVVINFANPMGEVAFTNRKDNWQGLTDSLCVSNVIKIK